MLERKSVLLVLIAGIVCLLALSCNRKTIPKSTGENTEHPNPTAKGTPSVIIPAPELEQTQSEIVFPKPTYLILRLEKTACYGECPVYELKFYSDGRALWHGESYCDRIGYHEAFVPIVWREQLIAQANDIHFFSLLDSYPPDGPYLSELPKTMLYLNDGDQEKSITQNYLTPKALIDFEETIIKMASGLGWEEMKHEN